MINIEEYMRLPLSQRQEHLKLNDPCVDRGRCYSVYLRGLLAYMLDTTLPYGNKIHVCHACNNDNCANPYHVYWGTPRENKLDADKIHKKTIWDYTVAKYGIEEAKKMNSANAHVAAKVGSRRTTGMTWITNGESETLIENNETIPTDWKRGRAESSKLKVSVTVKNLHLNGHYKNLT